MEQCGVICLAKTLPAEMLHSSSSNRLLTEFYFLVNVSIYFMLQFGNLWTISVQIYSSAFMPFYIDVVKVRQYGLIFLSISLHSAAIELYSV